MLPRSAFLLKLFLVLPSLNTYLVEILITYHFQGGKISPNYFYKGGKKTLKDIHWTAGNACFFSFYWGMLFIHWVVLFLQPGFCLQRQEHTPVGCFCYLRDFFFFSPVIFYTLIILLIFLNYIFYLTLKSVISFIFSFPHLNILKIFFINLHHFFSCGS